MKRAYIVCGSRHLFREDHYRAICNAMRATPAGSVIIHGAAQGADEIAAEEASALGRRVVAMPAQWDRDGKAAGMRRNAAMLRVLLALGECGYHLEVIAFPMRGKENRGTNGMCELASKAGVTVSRTEVAP